MDDSDLKGYPIPLLRKDSEGQFQLNDEAMEILSQDNIKNRAAVVISVAGAYRKGKSFLLDFFLRYMNFTYASSSEPNIANYLGDKDSPLEGFDWNYGSIRCTTGIFMWSNIFCVTLPNDEEVAVIFLDTQGTFDGESTVLECTTIFAISTMISSIQIYNLSANIQEDNLEYLQLFTEYGKLALQSTEKTPFQKLMFLVRDWQYGDEKPYGNEGGRQLVESKLSVNEQQSSNSELTSVREHIKSCFTDVDGFLLPYPGRKVASNKFDGRLSDIDEEFIQYLYELILLLLSRENLLPKEICGRKVKVKELKQYLESYTDLFNNGHLPEPKSIFQATADANNLSELIAAEETYKQSMDACCQYQDSYLTSEEFESKHEEFKKNALKLFLEKPKIGENKSSKIYLGKLKDKIECHYMRYKLCNDAMIYLKQVNETIKAATTARETYKRLMMVVCGKNTKYLTSDELESQHDVFKMTVLEGFDAECKPGGDELSIMYRQNLEINIKLDYDQFEARNKLKKAEADMKNASAVAAARELYRQLLMSEVSIKPNACFKSYELELIHEKLTDKAFEQFHEQCGTERDDCLESWRKKLKECIESYYTQFKSNNENKMKAEANAKSLSAKDTYRNAMMRFCDESNANICSDALEIEHDKFKQAALSQFFDNCEIEEYELSEYSRKLEQDIEAEYAQIRIHNENQNIVQTHANNLSAVTASGEKYCQLMEEFFGVPTAYVNSATLADEHIKCEKEAFDQYWTIRAMREGELLPDIYRTQLKHDIKDKYDQFKTRNELNEANTKANYLSKLESAEAVYRRNMTTVCGNPNLIFGVDSDTLESRHFQFKRKAIDEFRANCDMLANEFYEYYSEELERVINAKYSEFRDRNEKQVIQRQSLARCINLRALANAKRNFNSEVISFIERQTNSNLSLELFLREYIRLKDEALSQFEMQCEGGPEFSRAFIERLRVDIEADYTRFKKKIVESLNRGYFTYFAVGGTILFSIISVFFIIPTLIPF